MIHNVYFLKNAEEKMKNSSFPCPLKTQNDAKMTQNDTKKDQKYLLPLPGFEPTAFFPPRV